MMIKEAITHYINRTGHLPGPVRAALIDMDGTLYDSMPNHAMAWHRMVSELGLPSNPDEYFIWEGMTGAQTINIIFNRHYGHDASAEEVKELYSRKTRYFREMPTVEIMPGATAMISTLMDRGVARVLVTGSGQSSLINRLDADFPGAFAPSLRVTAYDVEHGKPDPEPFLKASEKVGVPIAECIAIDNAPSGVMSASRSGAFAVGVVTGPIPSSALWDAGADIVFQSMPEFAAALPALLDAIADAGESKS